jgi:hypothetical protein
MVNIDFMDISTIIYFGILFFAFIISIFVKKRENSMRIFPFLLFTSLIAEILAHLSLSKEVNYLFYHLYAPIDYIFWAFYFYFTIKIRIVKKAIIVSIPVFIIICILCSLKYITFTEYPNFQLNIEGLLLVIWSVIAIFNIEYDEDVRIISKPVFWICVSLLIYNCVTFSFIGFRGYIEENKKDLVEIMMLFLLKIPNYLLYLGLSVAFICSHKITK